MVQTNRRVLAVAGLTCAVAMAIPAGAKAYRRYRTARERAALVHFLQDPLAGDEGWLDPPGTERERQGGERDEREGDDPIRRAVLARTLWGVPRPEVMAEQARIAHEEARRWPELMPGAPGRSLPGFGTTAVVAAPSWVSVGPSTAAFQWNALQYSEVDSGRVSGLLVNPADPAQVIIATSGGGLWRTYNFGVPNPGWIPMGETLPNLAIGSIDANPASFNELYVGTGDFIDAVGGQMVKTTDGGGSWSAPIQLSGLNPGGGTVSALRVSIVKVDPANPNLVLVGTDVGLFRSVDAGASYQLVDLPNDGGPARLERVWSIVYTGQVGGVSRWAASGVYACDRGQRPPDVFTGTVAGGSNPGLCAFGNPGDIWVSTDAGLTWSSRSASTSGLPATVGRITLAAGTPSTANPPLTVIYAQLADIDEWNASDAGGFWRSVNSGLDWAVADGTLANPTSNGPGGPDCPNVLNAGFGQGSYNHAIAVDPGNDQRVLVGGQLCAMRTSSGRATIPTWENVTHWLPVASPYGNTNAGTLDYAHADHHRALIVRFGATVRALLATDGGLYWTDSLFAAGSPTNANVVWSGANRGLVTHLVFGMGSGDPQTGTANRVVLGMQDNGTRLRDPSSPTTFNQVNGGDGFGAAHNGTVGAEVYWAASNSDHEYCVPSAGNAQCNQGGAFNSKQPPLLTGCAGGDSYLFKNVFSPAPASPNANSFVSTTRLRVFRISGNPATSSWQQISPCTPTSIRNVVASPNLDGLYGAALAGGRFLITSNCTASATTCTWTQSQPLGFDVDGDRAIRSSEQLSYTSSISFPPGSTGSPVGDVYVATSAAPVAQDGQTVVPARLGRIFLTTDRGQSWVPLHGNGTGFDLPNVPINVVKYDPGDLTNQTLFVGNLLGVYRTTDGGNTWRRYGVGLPLVSVTEMFIGRTGGILRVGTYGRGAWELYPNATAEHGVAGNGDWDRDVQIDFLDMAALATRLGKDPSSAAAPFYDWASDLTGTVNAIDDADLQALLAKFGNHP